MRSKFYFSSDVRKPFIKKYLPVLIKYCFFKRLNYANCTILNHQQIWMKKITKPLKFHTPTYKKTVAPLLFCCNGMGNVSLESFVKSRSHSFFH